MTKEEFIAHLKEKRSAGAMKPSAHHVCDARFGPCLQCKRRLEVLKQDAMTTMGGTMQDFDYKKAGER